MRKSIRINVSKCLKESMLTNWNKWSQIWVRKLISLPPNLTLSHNILSVITSCTNTNWSAIMRFLPVFLSVYPGERIAAFVEMAPKQCGKESQTCWSVFGARTVLSFIYSVALPWSSMSHFHCWCWCHFSNASMGTGICMTPPPAALATNSSFNTSSKCPVCHTVFQLVPVSLFVLNNETFVACVTCRPKNTHSGENSSN